MTKEFLIKKLIINNKKINVFNILNINNTKIIEENIIIKELLFKLFIN